MKPWIRAGAIVPLALSVTVMGAAGGCSEPSVDLGDEDAGVDSGSTAQGPSLPQLERTMVCTPNSLVAIKGTANGATVVFIQETNTQFANPQAIRVAGGTFCLDVALREKRMYVFEVFAQDSGGRLSSPVNVQVKYTERTECSGSGEVKCNGLPVACQNNTEVCNNMFDDDCDGVPDAMEPTCQAGMCVEDFMEPNNEVPAAAIEPGVAYQNLAACPGNPDYYGLQSLGKQNLSVTVTSMGGSPVNLTIHNSMGMMVAGPAQVPGGGSGSIPYIAPSRAMYYVLVATTGSRTPYQLRFTRNTVP